MRPQDRKYREWQYTNQYAVPSIQFDCDMEVEMVPPFGGALVRMVVNGYSIYFDVDETLGFYNGEPYREIYDPEDGCYRFNADNTEGLLNKIRELSN